MNAGRLSSILVDCNPSRNANTMSTTNFMYCRNLKPVLDNAELYKNYVYMGLPFKIV